MPLTGKYLKYSPEITLEIFTLIYNKLEDSGFQSIKKSENYKYFSQSHNFLVNTKGNYYFTRDKYSSDLDGKTETTVQEILGYDPFVKDDFVLPEKWYIKCTPESKESLDEWTGFSWKYDYIYFNGKSKCWSNTLYDDHTEITFEQFKKYVLKESIENPKEVIPEYVELLEGFDNTCTGKIFDTNQPIPQMSGWSNQWTWESIFKNNIQRSYFKPSTKEAFDAQNLKSVEIESNSNCETSLIEKGNKIHEDYFKTINSCSEVYIKGFDPYDENLSIFPTFEENSIQILEIEINKNYFVDFKDPYN